MDKTNQNHDGDDDDVGMDKTNQNHDDDDDVGMDKTNQSHDDDDDDVSSSPSSSRRKRFKTFEKGGVAPWADLQHHVLFLVMMRLSAVDFIAFSGVCKSWRSFSLSNRNTFMTSRPPMEIGIEPLYINDEDEGSYCVLDDIQGPLYRTILPHSKRRPCFGVTCGYLILFGRFTRDFWLVNPITRHELHFPNYPSCAGANEGGIRAILVFSPSISGWVLVVLHRNLWRNKTIKPKLSYCIAGKQRWNHVPCTDPILDLHFFKGKIYTLRAHCILGELRLDPKHKGKTALLEINILQKPNFPNPWLVSSNESLYLIDSLKPKKVMELDFGEKKWVSAEKTKEEYAFFLSFLNSCVAVKPESWAGPLTQFKRCGYFLDSEEDQHQMDDYKFTWYFPYDSLNANLSCE